MSNNNDNNNDSSSNSVSNGGNNPNTNNSSKVRHRRNNRLNNNNNSNNINAGDETDSDIDSLPQQSQQDDNKPKQTKFQKFWTRFKTTWSMIFAFCLILYIGHWAVATLLLILQV